MSVQVGLGTFVPGVDQVSARGTFNNWNTMVLTNNPSGLNTNLYSGTVNDTTNPNGGVESYKFYNSRNGQWDDGAVNNSGKNRAGRLPSTSGGTVALPVVFFGDADDIVVDKHHKWLGDGREFVKNIVDFPEAVFVAIEYGHGTELAVHRTTAGGLDGAENVFPAEQLPPGKGDRHTGGERWSVERLDSFFVEIIQDGFP